MSFSSRTINILYIYTFLVIFHVNFCLVYFLLWFTHFSRHNIYLLVWTHGIVESQSKESLKNYESSVQRLSLKSIIQIQPYSKNVKTKYLQTILFLSISLLITFLESLKFGSPPALIFTVITVSSTADKIFKPSYRTDSYGKNSITLGAINSWNKTQHQFSDLSLKTFSPTKIKSLLFKKCIGKY